MCPHTLGQLATTKVSTEYTTTPRAHELLTDLIMERLIPRFLPSAKKPLLAGDRPPQDGLLHRVVRDGRTCAEEGRCLRGGQGGLALVGYIYVQPEM